jgi:glycyl-tRNA synthetase alpha chain
MYLQGVDNIFDIIWNETQDSKTTYKDVHLQSEIEFSKYNFEIADTDMLFAHFEDAKKECKRVLQAGLPLPAYDQCLIASHTFNVLDARKAISQTQRQEYILQIRELSSGCASLYKEQESQREENLKRQG